MTKTASLKKNNPEAYNTPHILEAAEQSDILHDLVALESTPGGKTLIKLLIKDAIGNFHRLRGSYREASRDELVSIIASMSAQYDTARLLINAKESERIADEILEEALSE